MPGLLGVASLVGPRIGLRVEAARERLLRHGHVTVELVTTRDETCWLAHARLADSPRTIVDGGQRPSAVFHGVLHNESDLRQEFGGNAMVEAVGDLIAAMYERLGPTFVERLEGEFVVALMDPARRTMMVASDPVGNYPLYWHAEHQEFVFSSDLSAVLRAVPDRNRLDLQAVGDYLTIGAVLEDRTLVEGVRLLDAGTLIEFNLDRGEVRQQKYIDSMAFFADKATDREQYLEAVAAVFQTAVERASAGQRPVGISLSGGIDSRTILGALNGRAAGLSTYTLGVAGCADQVIARQLASIAKTKHRFFELDGSYLKDFLPNMSAMVSLTDGLYLSHGLTEMLALKFLSETGVGILLRGHGGELAKAHLAWPLHTDPRAYASPDLDEFLPYLAKRANYVTPGLPLDRVLSPRAATAAGEGSLASFRRVLAGASLTPAEACSYLYFGELFRRFTVPSLELFRTKVEVRLPFMDLAFLRTLLAAPAEWRDNTDIHQRITKRGLPELLKVRNSNTGAPLDSGPTVARVLDKVNSALRKFNVHGYRHYHNYDEWMRISLLDSVQAELTGDWARIRGIVDKATINTLARETLTGQADRSYLLQALLIIELWMRENRIEVGV